MSKYRIKKLLIIPENTQEKYDKRLENNQVVTCEPISFCGYNFIIANEVIYRVPASWLHKINRM